jgi:hypothetical protein
LQEDCPMGEGNVRRTRSEPIPTPAELRKEEPSRKKSGGVRRTKSAPAELTQTHEKSKEVLRRSAETRPTSPTLPRKAKHTAPASAKKLKSLTESLGKPASTLLQPGKSSDIRSKQRELLEELEKYNYVPKHNELSELQNEVVAILGINRTTSVISRQIQAAQSINFELSELAETYRKEKSTARPARLSALCNQYVELAKKLETALQIKALEKVFQNIRSEKTGELTDGAKLLVDTFKGLKLKILLDTAAQVGEATKKEFNELSERLSQETPKAATAAPFLTQEQRLKIYGNVVYMKERLEGVKAKELSKLQKLEKKVEHIAKKILVADQSKLTKLYQEREGAEKALKDVRKEFGETIERYQTLSSRLDSYYEQFEFTDDELASPEFRALTLEAFRPTRSHLAMFADDLLQGAQNVYVEKKNELEATLQLELAHLEVSDTVQALRDASFIDWREIKNELQKSDKPELVAFANKIEEFEKKCTHFEKVLDELGKKIEDDPRLGNKNREEKLPLEKDDWKVCMKGADKAIGELAEALKTEYIVFSGAKEKDASKAITAARDALINSRERWSEPIDCMVRLPVGSLPSHSDKEFLEFMHFMSCPNKGRASSAFRGREDSEDAIQPNWWNVQLGDGDLFSRSSTSVEFFSKDEKERKAASKRQVLEVISEKALKKAEKAAASSLEKPLLVPITEVSLFAPDALRGLIAGSDDLTHLVKAKTDVVVDPSLWERRLLQENQEAWMAFDTGATWESGKTFLFTDGTGLQREVTTRVNENGDAVYEIEYKNGPDEGKKIYVQFDVAYYNAGCNHFTKLMTEAASKEQTAKMLQKKADALVTTALNKLEAVGGFVQSLASLGGIDLEPIKTMLSDTELDPTIRLLGVLSFILEKLPELLSSNAGLLAIKALEYKLGITLDKSTLEHIKAIDFSKITDAIKENNPEKILLSSIQTLKFALLNPGVQSILNSVAQTETATTHAQFEALSYSIPSEDAIKELLGKDKVGIEELFISGFPVIRSFISNPLGESILTQIIKIKKGKDVTADDMAMLKAQLPTEFAADLGNKLENDMNIKSFDRHKNRAAERFSEIESEMEELNSAITDEMELAKITEMESHIERIADLRNTLVKADSAYKLNKSEDTIQAKNKALADWQKARDKLAKDLDRAINMPSPWQSEEFTAYMRDVSFIQDVNDLLNELGDMLEFQPHRDTEFMQKNMYTLSSLLVTLAIKLEENPHTGCRSGKDRTSLQDMEIATRLAMRKIRGRFQNYREREADPFIIDVREQMLLHTGQIDKLAYKNIGSFGLNLAGGFGSYIGGASLEAFFIWQHSVGGGAYKAFKRNPFAKAH